MRIIYGKENCNILSLWFGDFKSLNDAQGYFNTIYQGDYVHNQFGNDFLLSFDEDFSELNFITHASENLEDIFKEFSYYKTFKEDLYSLLNGNFDIKYNTIFIVYDFLYDRYGTNIINENYNVDFIGTLAFEKK